MQPKTRILTIALVSILAGLALGGCYGGDSGRVWFNMPSAKVNIQSDGTATAYGIPVGQVLDPALVAQMDAGGVEELDARIGYNGIHVYVNGQDLPYVAWDAASTDKLQNVLGAMPTVPPAASRYLPWLRKIGLGAKLILPSSTGSVERWSGETTVAQESAPDNPLSMNIGGIAFDEAGNLVIDGLDTGALAAAAGGALPSLDAGTLGMLQSLGIDSVNVNTTPNGVNLSINGEPLPSVAYDSKSLDALTKLLPALPVDAAMVDTVSQFVPMLPGLDVNADVSFTGEPIGTLELPDVNVAVADDGSLSAYGLTLAPAGTLDDATLATLEGANIGSVNVDVDADGLFAAVNGAKLPSISWNDASIAAIAGIAGAAAGQSPETVEGVLNLVRTSGLTANLVLPGGEAQTGEVDRTMQPPAMGDMTPPTVHLDATFDKSGALKSIGTLGAEDLAALGVPLDGAALPPQLLDLMDSSNASTMNIATQDNKLIVSLGGQEALAIDYDAESLSNALDLAAAFAPDSPLSDPALSQLINDVILPLAPGADVNINVMLE